MSAIDVDISGDTGTISILDNETLTMGTTNEIETSATGNTVTIGLPTNVTVAGTLTCNAISIAGGGGFATEGFAIAVSVALG